jgi:hypothetical protein
MAKRQAGEHFMMTFFRREIGDGLLKVSKRALAAGQALKRGQQSEPAVVIAGGGSGRDEPHGCGPDRPHGSVEGSLDPARLGHRFHESGPDAG